MDQVWGGGVFPCASNSPFAVPFARSATGIGRLVPSPSPQTSNTGLRFYHVLPPRRKVPENDARSVPSLSASSHVTCPSVSAPRQPSGLHPSFLPSIVSAFNAWSSRIPPPPFFSFFWMFIRLSRVHSGKTQVLTENILFSQRLTDCLATRLHRQRQRRG